MQTGWLLLSYMLSLLFLLVEVVGGVSKMIPVSSEEAIFWVIVTGV